MIRSMPVLTAEGSSCQSLPSYYTFNLNEQRQIYNIISCEPPGRILCHEDKLQHAGTVTEAFYNLQKDRFAALTVLTVPTKTKENPITIFRLVRKKSLCCFSFNYIHFTLIHHKNCFLCCTFMCKSHKWQHNIRYVKDLH